MPRHRQSASAFSMIELVLVVAIMGVIGAIAIPRLSSVSENVPLAAYKADLITIQNAVERYMAEHQGTLPKAARFAIQLTQFTDIHGNVSSIKTTTHVYGPYLRKMPEVYVGPHVTEAESNDADLSDGTSDDEVAIRSATTSKVTAWLYNEATGQVRVRVASVDGVKTTAESVVVDDGL